MLADHGGREVQLLGRAHEAAQLDYLAEHVDARESIHLSSPPRLRESLQRVGTAATASNGRSFRIFWRAAVIRLGGAVGQASPPSVRGVLFPAATGDFDFLPTVAPRVNGPHTRPHERESYSQCSKGDGLRPGGRG